jgi:DNA-directed RNA polymerase beta' subunit
METHSNIDTTKVEDNKELSNPFGTYKTKKCYIQGYYKFNCKELGDIIIEVPVATNWFQKTTERKGFFKGYKTTIVITCKKLNIIKTIRPEGLLKEKSEIIKEVKKVFNPIEEMRKLKLEKLNNYKAECIRVADEERREREYYEVMDCYYEEGIM